MDLSNHLDKYLKSGEKVAHIPKEVLNAAVAVEKKSMDKPEFFDNDLTRLAYALDPTNHLDKEDLDKAEQITLAGIYDSRKIIGRIFVDEQDSFLVQKRLTAELARIIGMNEDLGDRMEQYFHQRYQRRMDGKQTQLTISQ